MRIVLIATAALFLLATFSRAKTSGTFYFIVWGPSALQGGGDEAALGEVKVDGARRDRAQRVDGVAGIGDGSSRRPARRRR
jgi:hypothetical protein